jgi:hypothetical protein
MAKSRTSPSRVSLRSTRATKSAHASPFSRGNGSSEVCQYPSIERGKRSADRRPGAAAPVVVGGPLTWPARVPARISFRNPRSRGTLASRRSTAAVFWPRARQGVAFGRCLTRRCPMASAGAFARSARSGGWAVLLGRLPGARLRAVHAGRRIPLRLWLVSGDALGERDGRTIVLGPQCSSGFACYARNAWDNASAN